MVDALGRACSLLYAGGVIVDIHPTPEPARLELATGSDFVRLADRLDDGTASGPRQRHAAADDALAACVSAGMFDVAAATEFTFHTLADGVDELAGYLAAKWKQLHFADADLSRARDALARSPGSALAVTERVTVCRLTGI
jgi:hypothetical protein